MYAIFGGLAFCSFSYHGDVIYLFSSVVHGFALTGGGGYVGAVYGSSRGYSLFTIRRVLVPFGSIIFRVIFGFDF